MSHNILQGNAYNQSVAFDNKIIDYVNYILRNKQYKVCDPEDILELKTGIQQLVKAMCEENRSVKDQSKVSQAQPITYVKLLINISFLVLAECRFPYKGV